MNRKKIEKAVRDILEAIGEDPSRKDLLDTPSRVAQMYEDTGCFAVCTACSPENIPAVESAILEEWERLMSEPVDDAELTAAKRIYEGTLTRDCETNMFVAGVAGIEALLYKIEPFAESIQRINAVTGQDVMDAANRYLDTNNYTMITVGRN